MKLAHVRIGGYRSIGEALELHVDDHVTVILGANDHGKTNVLSALLHLNPDTPFSDGDLNWDYGGRQAEFPFVHYTFRLSDEEREVLLNRESTRVTTRSFAAFRENLESEAAAAEAKAESAQKQADAASNEQADQEGSSDAGNEESNTSKPPGDNGRLAAVAEQASSAAELARQRVSLARAEELRARAQLLGDQTFDLLVATEQAEQAEAEARDRHDETRRAAARAGESVTEAETTHGAGSAEHEAAQKAANEAVDVETSTKEEADELSAKAKDYRRAADASVLAQEGSLDFGGAGKRPPKFPMIKLGDIPTLVTVGRTGYEAALAVVDPGVIDAKETMDYMGEHLPRVELFQPQLSIPDLATAQNIDAPDNDFMRGIFRYAGLTQEEWGSLFEQTDATTMRLANANDRLNETLRTAWSQGRDLQFELDHRGGEIDLKIKDPAVKSTFVRASRRSSGFTHFFALKTMLFAREQASEASSFIWLFDEPGLYLHPEGQHDLLQVLETLAQSNQVAYATHSIFLVNKNHPTRHRLLKKDVDGTSIDQKPYVGRWRSAIDALGLALPGTILFASKVLLVEGDSDPILLNADLQALIGAGDLDIDLNPLSIMATGDGRHADALARILLDAAVRPTIGLLFDGDDGGTARIKQLKALMDQHGLAKHQLKDGTTVEDHLVAPEIYREATIRYVERIAQGGSAVRSSLEGSYGERFANRQPAGLAEWARDEGKKAGGLDEPPSSVGIAREYASLLADPEQLPSKKTRKRATELAEAVAKMLELRPQTVSQERILEDEEVLGRQ